MLTLLHDQLIQTENANLSLDNRGFRYNDGFFETLLFLDGELQNWVFHRARIQRGATAMHLSFPIDFATQLPQLLTQLVAANGLTEGRARVRWQCWREGKGLYTPQSTAASWMATVEPLDEGYSAQPNGRAGISTTIETSPSKISFLKGPNAALYTLASIEREQRGLDELILLSPRGHVAESTSACVCWVQYPIVFAPDAALTGAVDGIGLAAFADRVQRAGWYFRTGTYRPSYLYQAEALITVNSLGWRWLASLDDRQYAPHRLASQLA